MAHWATDAVDVVRTTDPIGNHDVLILDQYGLPIRNVDGENVDATTPATTNYTYGAFNLPRTVVDKLNTVTTFLYDDLSRLHQHLDPNTGTRTYTYNAFDELKTAGDARGQVSTYFYDALGRVERVEHSTDGNTEFIYDEASPGAPSVPNAQGKLVEAISPPTAANPSRHRKRYAYEPVLGGISNRGPLASVTDILDGQDFVTSVVNDEFGRADVITYPASGSGNPVRIDYAYDFAGHLARVDDITSGTTMLWQLVEADRGYRVKREGLVMDPFALTSMKTTRIA